MTLKEGKVSTQCPGPCQDALPVRTVHEVARSHRSWDVGEQPSPKPPPPHLQLDSPRSVCDGGDFVPLKQKNKVIGQDDLKVDGPVDGPFSHDPYLTLPILLQRAGSNFVTSVHSQVTIALEVCIISLNHVSVSSMSSIFLADCHHLLPVPVLISLARL